MLQIQFIYSENGKQKSDLDDYKRRVEILELNKRLYSECPLFKDDGCNEEI